MSPLFLSIIIPSVGRQSQLNELLAEIHQQRGTLIDPEVVEVIIIDDGSKPALTKPAHLNQTQLHWLRVENNCGAPHARKLGFSQSRGQYIHFHDSDDGITQGWLTTLLKRIELSKDLDIVVSSRIVKTERP